MIVEGWILSRKLGSVMGRSEYMKKTVLPIRRNGCKTLGVRLVGQPVAAWSGKQKAPFRVPSGSGAGIRTQDLQVMSLTSCHCSTPQRVAG
jgi:hypothetical protein